MSSAVWDRRYEIWTWLLIPIIYGGWAALTMSHDALPWWLLLPLGAVLVCWHGSFQHETIHKHPTRSDWFNGLLAFWPLSLWMPYGVYAETHEAHHEGLELLTEPFADPESFYVTPEKWESLGPLSRGFLWVNQTLLGRMAIGPLFAAFTFYRAELKQPAKGDFHNVKHWAVHLVGLSAVIAWLTLVCEMPLWKYVLLFAYPGMSLTLIRSFAEHRPAEDALHRTVIIRGGRFMSLLFLNNNLHAAHHRDPAIPWSALPSYYAQNADQLLDACGMDDIPSYASIMKQWAVRPKDPPVWPLQPAMGGGDHRAEHSDE